MKFDVLKVKLLIFCLLCCESIASDPAEEDSTKSIVDFWRQQEEEFQLGKERDIVLLLGNTGCGKSTLASLLTNVDLESVETFPGSSQYVLVDKNDRISKPNETITSKTLLPELIADTENGISYYDCPGFEDTRSVKHDISITYSIKKLLDFSNSVKLVFLVSYTSVKVAGSRNDFINLAEHATTLVKDIGKFRDGITLVVSKVENRIQMVNGTPTLIDDATEINGIAHFLTQSITELETSREQASSAEQHAINEKIKFIEILLTKGTTGYDRISIIRLACEPGPVKGMQLIQEEKQRTNEIVNKNLHYVRKDEGDFGLTIADKSKARVLELMDEMKNYLDGIASNIDNEIKQFYVQQEKQNTDIKSMYTMIYSIYQTFQVPKSKEAKLFLQQTTETMASLGINDGPNFLNKFSNGIKLIEFLKEVSGHGPDVSIEITSGLKNSVNYFDETRKWYNFLINLHPIVSGYSSREEGKKILATLIEQKIVEDGSEIKFDNNNLQHLITQTGSGIYDDVGGLPVNSFKVNALRRLLEITSDENISQSCEANKLVVKGINVKISEVMKAECWANVKYVDVFALDRVFVDADIDKTGKEVQLSIIAPSWEIVGDRQIILNGENAQPHAIAQAPNAASNKESGKDGEPGLPGGVGGEFLGSGKDFFNGPYLKISANGGAGSTGQNGGNGAIGEKGETPGHLRGHSPGQQEELRQRTRGSSGGNGGVGGLGGIAGKVTVVGLNQPPGIRISTETGPIGASGVGGSGGAAGYLEYRWEEKKRVLGIKVGKVTHHESWSGTVGPSGQQGTNNVGSKQPQTAADFISPNSTVSSFSNFASEKLASNAMESYIGEFLRDLKL